jgi:hypothetical protein
MRRLLVTVSAAALVLGFMATPSAWAQQSVGFYLGGFMPRALDARDNNCVVGAGDVLACNSAFLSTFNRTNGIDISKFSNVTVGGEWLFGIGNYLEGGLGLGYYQRTVPTSYTDFTNSDGSEIAQNLKLRIVPFTATVRLLPFGNRAPIQPYIGGGVAAYRWRYSETGQFIDPDNNVITGNFVGSGGAAGPVVLGGVRVPMGPYAAGFEIRHQSGKGTLPNDQGFSGSTIDLGGFNYLFTFNFRF